MHTRPQIPAGGLHQSREIAEVVLHILYKHGRKGQYVELNEHLRRFSITHPAELSRALKWLIEEPQASVLAQPDPRAEDYGAWSHAAKAALITKAVRAKLTTKGLEDYHRQRALVSSTALSKWAIVISIAALLVSVAAIYFDHLN